MMHLRNLKPVLIKRRTAWIIIATLCAVVSYLAFWLIRQLPI